MHWFVKAMQMTLEDQRLNRPFDLQKRFHAHCQRDLDAGKTARAFSAAECEVQAHNAQAGNVATFNSYH
jgi:hypothetical protein